MRRVSYRDWCFEVDYHQNKATYESEVQGSTALCSCSICKNFAAQKASVYPEEIKLLLGELGIDYQKEAEAYHIMLLDNQKHYYGGWFHFKGQLLEGKFNAVPLAKGGYQLETIPIEDSFRLGFVQGTALSIFPKEEFPNLIQLEFLVELDWVLSTTPYQE